jgi:hypothetical protein
MKFLNDRTLHFFPPSLKLVTAFFVGGIAAHLSVMFLDYYLLTKPLYLNLKENFFNSIFSNFTPPERQDKPYQLFFPQNRRRQKWIIILSY